MVVARRGIVSLDCAEPAPLAAFWGELLGAEVTFATPESVGVRTDWIWLSTMKVPDYRAPTWPSNEVPKQIHLNLAVDDLEAAVREAVKLGARLAPDQPAPDEFRVLLDPAGHPFCLTTQIPPDPG
jgi:hypothetical protein